MDRVANPELWHGCDQRTHESPLPVCPCQLIEAVAIGGELARSSSTVEGASRQHVQECQL